ncbi:MAG: prolyl oligopeptidase family serine peptidase [Candidatus Acidiferrales bacterium]
MTRMFVSRARANSRWHGLCLVVLLLAVFISQAGGQGAPQYQRPPKAVQDVLDAAETPVIVVGPANDVALLVNYERYSRIADLSQPMLRLAGVRINPATNGPHNPRRYTAITIKSLVDSEAEDIAVQAPKDALLGLPSWAPGGKRFVFTVTTDDTVQLWVGNPANGGARQIQGIALNAVFGSACDWMPGATKLLCRTVPAGRGKPPEAPAVPAGPHIEESSGKPAPVRTYQDLLQNSHDQALFDYYATSQLMLVDTTGGADTPLGKPAIFAGVEVAPDGKHFLIERIVRPYSYLVPAFAFPSEVEIWDRAAKVVHKVASVPLAENVPIGGVITGPRSYQWQPTEPAALVWVEALDGGNPRTKVANRDRVLRLKAPFKGQPEEIALVQHRYRGITWGERGDLAILREYDRARDWQRTWFFDPRDPAGTRKLVWDLSTDERYKDPGTPVLHTIASARRAMVQDGDFIFLAGRGSSPEGDRPFVDRFNVKTLKAERLFQSDERSYEAFDELLAPDGSRFLTRYESPSSPPNYVIRTPNSAARQFVTRFTDPTPQLRGIKKELVRYKRADGVDLSFTLYLPPDYKPGERRPAVVWAYPLEFTDASTAGQVTGSPNRFTTITGYSHLFFLLQGYVVMDSTTMPVVGDPETVNNTYVEQIVSSSKAAIDKAAEMGVIDPTRVGVGGHSYGAFMTANLLAHCDLYRAGIARSGAYNRTLTPFGFQSERRTLWQATDTYMKVSPFLHAQKINEPILLIHGEADNNSGTFPVQSERMYHAVKGNGGTVRYVTLPHESHGYSARESVEHTLWEMLNWFERHVKNAGPRQEAAGAGSGRE